MWKDNFNENNLMLGKQMFDNKKVTFIYKKNNIIDAEVTDDEVYYIHINLNNFEIINSNCSCASDKGRCKHVAAVLNDIFYGEDQLSLVTVNERNDILKHLLSSINRELLEKFIFTTITENPQLEFMFSKFMNEHYQENSEFHNIDQIFNELKYISDDDFSFDFYYKSQELISLLTDEMAEYIQQLDFNIQEYVIVDMIDYVLTNFQKLNYNLQKLISIDLFNAIDNCLDYIYLDENSNINMLTQSIIILLNDHYDNKLFTIIYNFVKNNFDLKIHFPYALDILEELITKLDEIENANYLKTNYKYDVYEIFQTYLSKANDVDQDRKDYFLEKYADNTSVIDYIIDDLIDTGKLNEAKKHLIDQLENGVISNNYIKLEKIYEHESDEENLIKLYKNIVMIYHPGHHWYTTKLKAFYDEESFKSTIIDMIKQMNDNSAINSLLYRFNLLDLLVEHLTSNYDFEEFKKYHDTLKSIYPEKIYPLYEPFLIDMAIITSNRETYKYMVDLLRELKSINGGEEITERISKLWKEKYFKRTAMMDELNKL